MTYSSSLRYGLSNGWWDIASSLSLHAIKRLRSSLVILAGLAATRSADAAALLRGTVKVDIVPKLRPVGTIGRRAEDSGLVREI
jgi:hypothetical protein